MPKRILVIGQHYWPETFRITDICEGFVERGYEVDVLCGIPNYPAGKFFPGYGLFSKRTETRKGVNITRSLEIPRGNNSNARIFVNYISFPFFALFHLPRLMFRKYDRILAYQLSPVFMMFPAIIFSKVTRTKLFVYILDFWPYSLFSILTIKNNILRDFIKRISFWHYRQADGAIGAFKGIQTRLQTEVGLVERKTLYIPQAPEKIYEKQIHDSKLAKKYGAYFTIVFAGNINPAQDFKTITEAAKIVHNKGYDDIRYVIIGEGMSKGWLIDRVADLGISHQFIFEKLKPVEEIPKFQTIADALIVSLSKSALFEYGIPAKVQSYMASGRPIIGSMDGESKELINNHARCGICVESGDILGLSGAIIELVEMPIAKRKLMGQNGSRYYHEHYEREHNLTRMVEYVMNDNRIPDREHN